MSTGTSVVEFLNDNSTIPANETNNVKAIWGNCIDVMQDGMAPESISLIVTSPPYYNARDYSIWPDLNAYLADMKSMLRGCWRVLADNRVIVLNIADVLGNDHLRTTSRWGMRKIPLASHFIRLFEEVGFHYIDDIIWDKGEVQSHRHKNASNPYPMYQLPMNCYEHILVFSKHLEDRTPIPCPVCNSMKVNVNGRGQGGLITWECKDDACPEKSVGNRGKRFSKRSIMMDGLKTRENMLDPDYVKQWRRDIVRITPVIKVNCKGENRLGHTAPFPEDIPEFAVRMFSGAGEHVLDPFAGSFTSAIVANRLGRIGIGIEMQRDMFRDAILANVTKRNLMGLDELDTYNNNSIQTTGNEFDF